MNPIARTSIHIEPDLAHLTAFSAREILRALTETLKNQDRVSFMLSGGSTPKPLFKLLAASGFDWSRVDFFFSDERNVPLQDPKNNAGMATETFFTPAKIPSSQVYRIEGEKDASAAAQSYHEILKAYFAKRGGPAQFDICLLGMGHDGHTASLFPGTEWQSSDGLLAQAFHVESLDTWRISVSLDALRQSKLTYVLAAGAEKMKATREALGLAPISRELLPIEAITPENGALIWLLDHAAVFGEPRFKT